MGIAKRVVARFKQAKAKTFPEAKQEYFDFLRKRRWTIKDNLKVPHATTRDGRFRLWFKPQAVWFTDPGVGNHQLNNGLSLHVDIRKESPQDLIRLLERRFPEHKEEF